LGRYCFQSSSFTAFGGTAMIQKLSIRNFKSIRELDLDCRRVNVFIGEPNVGKTNALEALALLSVEALHDLKKVFRLTRISDLSSEQDSQKELSVTCDDLELTAYFHAPALAGASFVYRSKSNGAETTYFVKEVGDVQLAKENGTTQQPTPFSTSYYLFDTNSRIDLGNDHQPRLSPVFGENLAEFLSDNKAARLVASSFFETCHHRLLIDRTNRTLLVAREEEGALIALPYSSASETLRRMVFFSLALAANRDQTLIFDEPEAHSFPPYTKTLAERIALDDRGNQFFLTTHSPYMLDSLLSKTPAKDLNVVLCRMENFETKAYPMNHEQIDQIKEWSMDAFFNFDRLLPEVA
jgi:AAA15 family ATPase/GTPase